MSAIRAAVMGSAFLISMAPDLGIAFGILSTVGQVFAYRIGIRPTIDYQPVARPRLTRAIALSAITRTIGTWSRVFERARCRTRGELVKHRAQGRTDNRIRRGILSAFTSSSSGVPIMSPKKAMGVFGVGLILVGFLLQSFQYWAALFDWVTP